MKLFNTKTDNAQTSEYPTETAPQKGKTRPIVKKNVKDVDETASAIEAIVENSKLTGGYQRVPLYLLSTPGYQRGEQGKVGKIAKEWDDLQCDALTISFRDNKLYIVDGLQRKSAADIVGKRNLMCRIHTGLTERDEIKIYKNQNKNRVPMVAYDSMKAEAWQGDDPGVSVFRICQEMKVKLKRGRARAGECGCVAELAKTFNLIGEAGLKWVLSVLHGFGWNRQTNGYRKCFVTALTAIYEDKDEHDLVRDILVNKYQGTIADRVYFEAKKSYGDAKDANAMLCLFREICG